MIEIEEKKHFGIKSVITIFDEKLSKEAKNTLINFNNQEKSINY